MEYADFHSHSPGVGARAISSPFNIEDLDSYPYLALGVHPWKSLDLEACQQSWQLVREHISAPNILMVGESGLDRSQKYRPHFQRQLDYFEKHIVLAKEMKLPLVIHCVRAYGDILQQLKIHRPQIPWVMHDFNANEEQARKFLPYRCYFSFGKRILSDDLRFKNFESVIPLEKVLVESDASSISLSRTYQNLSERYGITVRELQRDMNKKFDFFKQKNWKCE